jgi:hypothetical protein
MSLIGIKYKATVLLLSILILLSSGSVCLSFDPFGYWIPRLPGLSYELDKDAPGITNPLYPFVHNSLFKGEFHVRPMFVTLKEGKFRDATGEYDFLKRLGFIDEAISIESMLRLQFARYSIRGYYTSDLRTFRGKQGNFDWPTIRVGADLDLVQNDSIRFGLDMDINWKRPTFSIATPTTSMRAVEWPRPVTAGLHFVYNPCNIGISSSFEVRYRFPIRAGTKIEELEISGGMRFPKSMIGTSALRAGWRYSSISHEASDDRIDIRLSTIFGEYVYYY